MPNEEHLNILRKGVSIWNDWRRANPQVKPDLGDAKMNGIPLSIPNLKIRDFEDNRLLDLGDLYIGESSRSINSAIDLRWANLSDTNLEKADLRGQYLRGTRLDGSSLKNAHLEYATLIDTNCDRANLSGCHIYGISAWSLRGKPLNQSNLIISRLGEPIITIDNLEVAQFVYLLLDSKKIRHVFDTITSKVVLILGRFTQLDRKAVLDAIREELRKRDYVPILFDFEKPASRDFTETISTLARMARFIVADITEPRSIPQELQAIVTHLSVPVQPLLQDGSSGEYGMFQDLRKYPWVLERYVYKDLEDLLATLGEKVIAPAESKAIELRE